MASKKDVTLAMNSTFDSSGIRQAQNGLNGLTAVSATASAAMKNLGLIAAAGFALATAGAISFGVEAVKLAAHSEAISKGMENAISNTGLFGEYGSKSIGKATDALSKHSKQLGELTGIDDEIINQVKTGWLAVPDIAAKGVSGINNLAKVTADIAAGSGKDFQAIASAFVKVTGDEETAMGKLQRQGIVLTNAQKETYQQILDANGEIAAQDYLIGELGKKYEGMATATANPFDRIKVIFENFQEDVGRFLLPAIETIVPKLQEFLGQLNDDPMFTGFLETLGQNFEDLIPVIFDTVQQLIPFVESILPTLNEILPTVNSLMGGLASVTNALGTESTDAFTPLSNVLGIIGILGGVAKTAGDGVTNLKKGLGSGWGPVIDALLYALNPVAKLIQFILAGLQALTGNQIGAAATMTGMSEDIIRRVGSTLGSMTPGMILTPGQQNKIIGQANGGITTSPGLSWVGEKGPELLSLPRGAQVTPLDKMGGNTYSITVNAGMGTSGAKVGEEIVNAIRKYERTSGQVFARA